MVSLRGGNFFWSQVLTIPLVHSGALQSFKAWDKARLERRQKRLAIWWCFKLLKSIAQMHSTASSIMRLQRRQWGWSPHAPLWLSRPGSSQKLYHSVVATVKNSNNRSSLAQHWAYRISSCPSAGEAWAQGAVVSLYPGSLPLDS